MNRKPELTKQEMEGFDNFCKEHYRNAMAMAQDIACAKPQLILFKEDTTPEQMEKTRRVIRTVRAAEAIQPTPLVNLSEIAFRVILERLTSPRIFLIDSWRKLSSEEHMVYSYPDPVEREKMRIKAEEISKQAREMITT